VATLAARGWVATQNALLDTHCWLGAMQTGSGLQTFSNYVTHVTFSQKVQK